MITDVFTDQMHHTKYFMQCFSSMPIVWSGISTILHTIYSGVSRISQRRGRQLSGGGGDTQFCQMFPKTAWNWKNLDAGRVHPTASSQICQWFTQSFRISKTGYGATSGDSQSVI